ncbi:MAG: hypothetical protein GF364_18280 [Candidatus Lokiarchaeota archaeon]|nr:hypothetical protein [Candidatus Lokiarchaeota archaeon]
MGSVGIVLLISGMVLNNILILLNIAIVYAFLMLIVLSLQIIIIYLRFAIQVTGEIKRLGLFIGIGFIIMLFGVISTSLESLFGSFSEIVGHSINLIGMILIFIGVLKMR